jgi:hypothetical protein
LSDLQDELLAEPVLELAEPVPVLALEPEVSEEAEMYLSDPLLDILLYSHKHIVSFIRLCEKLYSSC